MMVSEPIRPYYLFAALLILILAPSVLLAEDLKPPDSKNFAKEGTEQFLAILHEEKLSPDGERALVKVLADRLENEDYQIINEGFRHRLRNNPQVLDGVFPRIATAIRHVTPARDPRSDAPYPSFAEYRLGELLETVHVLGKAPGPIGEAIAQVVTDPAEHAYEKPLAAAMLFTNATYDKQMLAWLEKRLEAEGEFDRWMAAWSFGRAESAAKPAQQQLAKRLTDPSWTVRVMAGYSLMFIDSKPDPAVVSVLRESLEQSDVGVPVRSWESGTLSVVLTRNCYAVGGLGKAGRAARKQPPKSRPFSPAGKTSFR